MSSLLTRVAFGTAVAAVALIVASASLAVTAKPSITHFTPTTAKVGVTVTVTGKDLKGITAVRIGRMKVTWKDLSATKITLKVPSKAKSGKITVVTKTGTAVSAAMLKV